jgi:hypothetical protein
MKKRSKRKIAVHQQTSIAAPGEIDFEHLPPQRLRRQISEHGLEGSRLVRLADVKGWDAGPACGRRDVDRRKPARLPAARVKAIGRAVERAKPLDDRALG